MLRGIGLSLYLACLGLDAGSHFFETVMRPEGALWIGLGFLITFVPVVIMALVALRCAAWISEAPAVCFAEVWQTPWRSTMPMISSPMITRP